MKQKLHIHIDPIGGISGDMFISAMIDAKPGIKSEIKIISEKIIKDIKVSIKKKSNQHISGTKFNVELLSKKHNHHRSYKDIKSLIQKSFTGKNLNFQKRKIKIGKAINFFKICHSTLWMTQLNINEK